MKKTAILMILLLALMTFSAMSSQLVHATRADARAEGPQPQVSDSSKMWASQYWYAFGQAYNSPTWPGQGILFSSGYIVDSYAYYSFTMPAPPWQFTSLDIGVYGKAVSGNGLDVYVWNWASSGWDYVGTTGTTQNLYTWGVSPTNHIQGSSYEYRLRVYADDYLGNDDRYDMWYIDTYYTYTGSYSATIQAWCIAEGAYISRPITRDGLPSGYSTPHTFSLTGTHTFTVPSTDALGHSFYMWSNGVTSTTITVSSAGTYIAYYRAVKVDTVVDFTFTPNPVSPGATVTLSGTLKTTPGGSPVYPASVTVEYSTDGGATWHYVWTLSTNAAGQFSKAFTAPGSGTYQVRVRYAGSATYNPSSHMETLKVGPAVWGDYHFRLSPYTDVIHIKISGSVIYGVAEVPGVVSDMPLLGYIQGSTFYIFIDVPDGAYGNEMSMMVGSTSTLSGQTYQTTDGKSWSGPMSFTLVSASPASGSSTTESALTSAVEPQSWPATYNFRLSPWIDIVRLSVDGSVIHGTDEAPGFYYDQPVLGSVSGSFFVLGIDIIKAGQTYELIIIRASTSTMSGYAYRTTTGKSFVSGPTISFVSVPP